MKISAKAGNIAFYAMMPTFVFFLFSMLTWRGFYIVETQYPYVQFMTAEEYTRKIVPIYWENYILLAFTVACLIIFISSVFVYIYSDAELN